MSTKAGSNGTPNGVDSTQSTDGDAEQEQTESISIIIGPLSVVIVFVFGVAVVTVSIILVRCIWKRHKRADLTSLTLDIHSGELISQPNVSKQCHMCASCKFGHPH